MAITAKEIGELRQRWKRESYRSDRQVLLDTLLDTSTPVELRGTDLAGVVLNSTAAPELWSAWMQGAHLERVDLRFARLGSTFTDATISACDFTRSTFERATLLRAHVVDTLFVETKIRHVLMDRAVFDRCTFTGAHFEGSLRATTTSGGRGVVFRGCDFEGARFTGQEWRQATFIDCRFVRTVVTMSDFGAATFSQCRFEGGSWEADSIARARFDGEQPLLRSESH
ncbi:pentapeptide repeat-containing protein [uncultured Microbacterium sp.]|uniref:pentapeptide repeat-containing protein n=1 Tax=uncultured Microbacterium sp. TaxID=191216 RepID=UPI0025D1B547|nr:pentapeptide repeat-containing protein [uncultured Microbacterium sp.]